MNKLGFIPKFRPKRFHKIDPQVSAYHDKFVLLKEMNFIWPLIDHEVGILGRLRSKIEDRFSLRSLTKFSDLTSHAFQWPEASFLKLV
jgi:hypothetical protein